MPAPREKSLRLGAIIETLRESLAAAGVAGLLLGVALGAASGRVPGPGLLRVEQSVLFSLTGTLLSAVMTIIGVVLSVLVLAQQLASQQYSPRAIRTALRDRRTRLALGGLFGYVGFMLGVIEAIDTAPDDPLGVSLGLAASVAAIALVAYLIQRVTNGFRSDQLVARISQDTHDAAARIVERDRQEGHLTREVLSTDDVPEDAVVVHAPSAGYLQDVGLDGLARDLHDVGARLRLQTGVGDFVGEGTGMGWAWPADVDHDRVEDIVASHLQLGPTRTTQREVGSGIQQLIDVALRALSPAINDPYTAVQAVNTTTDLLQDLAGQQQRWLVGVVDDEVVVTVPRPLVWDLVDHTVSSVRRVAGRYPDVLQALVMLLRAIAAVRPQDRERAEAHLDAIEAEADAAGLLDVDTEGVHLAVERARGELGRRDVDEPPHAQEPDVDEPTTGDRAQPDR